MKKTRRIIALILTIIAINMATIGVYASEAETPMTEYIRDGVTYRVISVTMEESVPEYNEFLLDIAKKLFNEQPLIFGYIIDSRMNALNGFQRNYEDGSKSLYINENQTFKKGTQVFVHEMVHYKYNVPNAVLYQKDSKGEYKYKELMEVLTDIIAEQKYSEISTNVYEKAYDSKVIRELPKEYLDFLLQVYKGEATVTDEVNTWLNSLNESIKEEIIAEN